MPQTNQAQGAGNDRPDPLISKILQGDRRALGQLFDRDAGWMFGLALRFVDGASAADVTRDVFARLESDPASGVYPGLSLRGRVVRLVRHHALQQVSSGRARAAGSIPDLPSDGPASDFGLALLRLDGLHRRALTRAFWTGATPDRHVLRRALKRLSGALSDRLRTPPDSPDGLAAAELILGTLPPSEAEVIEQRAPFDDALSAVIGAWAEALSEIAHPLHPSPVPEGLREKVIGESRRLQVRSVLSDLDVIPTVISAVVAMLVAGAMLWVAQGGLRRDPVMLGADLVLSDPVSVISVSYQVDARRVVVYPDQATPDGGWISLKIGADDPVRLGALAPAPEITVLPVPDGVPGNLEGAFLLFERAGTTPVSGTLIPRD